MAVLSFAELVAQQNAYLTGQLVKRISRLSRFAHFAGEEQLSRVGRPPRKLWADDDVDWSDYDYGEWE